MHCFPSRKCEDTLWRLSSTSDPAHSSVDSNNSSTWTPEHSGVEQSSSFTCAVHIHTLLLSGAGTEAGSSCWGPGGLESSGISRAEGKHLNHMGKKFRSRKWCSPTWNSQDLLLDSLHMILTRGKNICLWLHHAGPRILETSVKPRILNQKHTPTITTTKRGRSWYPGKLKTHPRIWRLKDCLCQEENLWWQTVNETKNCICKTAAWGPIADFSYGSGVSTCLQGKTQQSTCGF